MQQFAAIEQKVNEISNQLGFRDFNFSAEKHDTAVRALSRFTKAMKRKVERNEIEDVTDIKIKLDFISNLIKKVNAVKFSTEQDIEKLKFIEENSAESLYEYHKNKLTKYFSLKLAKSLKFNYAMLKNYYMYQAQYEGVDLAAEKLEKLKSEHKKVFAAVDELQATTLENLEQKLVLRNNLVKEIPDLFNAELVEQAITTSKLNKDKIDELYKQQSAKRQANNKNDKPRKSSKPAGKAKKTIDMSKVKTNTVKTAYEDKGAENNAFASLFTK